MQEVALRLEFVDERNVAGESVARRDVVVEDDDLVCNGCQLPEFVFCWGDINEGDERVFAFRHACAIIVAARDEMAAFAPDASNGPDGPEAIRTSRMVKADFFHGSSGLVRGLVRGECCQREPAGGRRRSVAGSDARPISQPTDRICDSNWRLR